MADALDSKSSDRKIVWVQVPPPAHRLNRVLLGESNLVQEKVVCALKRMETLKNELYLSTIRQQIETLLGSIGS
jgi:hypothetical protein